ncbi:MAG: HEPN domain-containing protein [Methanothrix sp.]
MIALSAACCARWSPPGPRASNLCSRPENGSPKPRRTWRQRPCGPLSHLAYLAVFHSARAVLFRDGVREKSHYCIGLYLQKYVEEGTLEEEWPMLFDMIRSIRHADQYSFMTKPTEEVVQAGIDLAERFIERMERLLRETGGGTE